MTAHRTLVGVDVSGKLVQVPCASENLPKYLRFELHDNQPAIDQGPLAGFSSELSLHGISFIKNNKYLCALKDSVTLIADRDQRMQWETFAMIPDEKISEILINGHGGEGERFCKEVLRLGREGRPVKIYCGAGQVPRPGFLNLDIAINAPTFFTRNFNEYFIFPFADAAWPLPDECVDYIFHEDFIEHITQLMQFQFLAETLRVLKSGCWHRVNTPNVLAAMKRHSNFKQGFRGVYTGEKQWGHISILSPLSLKEMAELVGYREVVFTTRHHGVSPYAEKDFRPEADRDEVLGNIYADLLK
jgi:hypothetical protein